MYLRILLAIDEEVVARHAQPLSLVILSQYIATFAFVSYHY